MYPRYGWALLLIFPIQMMRLSTRNRGSLRERVTYAFFQMIARFAEGYGQAKFLTNLMRGQRSQLIEYK